MNKALADPQEAFNLPRTLEDSLEEGKVLCVAFNACGTLLAAGLEDGKIVIWDFEVRGIARTTQAHHSRVVQVAWSKDGRLLASASFDGAVLQWDLEHDKEVGRVHFQYPVKDLSVSRGNARQCLVTLQGAVPHVVDFSRGTYKPVPLPYTDGRENLGTPLQAEGGIAATLSHKGDLIYVAMPTGLLCVISYKDQQIIDILQVPQCNGQAVSASLSRNGKILLINYSNHQIRSFDIESSELAQPHKTISAAYAKKIIELGHKEESGSLLGFEPPFSKLTGQTFQNRIEKSAWKCATYSSDHEYVAGASGVKDGYKIYLWNRWARHECVLSISHAPAGGLVALAWHPCSNLLVAVTGSGAIHLWAQMYKENWSAFAPDFRELQFNEEYIEPEDIFDVNPKTEEETQPAPEDMEVEVDIFTPDKGEELDSDGEAVSSYFHHLPVEIQPQEFDSKGKLIVPKTGNDLESPAISSKSVSEHAVSMGEDEVKRQPANKEKHRLANVTLADGSSGMPATDAEEDDDAILSD